MNAGPDQPLLPFRIIVSPDNMEVSLRASRTCAELTGQMVLDALQAEGIQITPDVAAEVENLCHRENPLKPKEKCIIARGVPPVHATAPRIEPVELPRAEGEGRDRSSIPSATAGMVVGRVIPGMPGISGTDVFGKSIPFREATTEIPLGRNVQLSEDGTSVVATLAGLIQMKRGTLGVETAMEVPGNLDYSVGNVNFAGSVLVRGNVADLFKIIAKEDIYVGGAVEAADLTGGHNVEVHGGICCRDKGHIIAGNDLRAKFISNATVESGNDIIVHSEIANSQVACRRQLTVVNGPIYASHVSAAGGVHAVILGSAAQARTLVECGIDASLRRAAGEKLPEIQESLKQIARVREVVEPLLQHQKNLTAEQKEKATEMLYEANRLQLAAHENMRGIAEDYRRYLEISAGAEVVVNGTIHPGVVIRFPEAETTIRTQIKGPVRIVCRKVGGIRTILAINPASKSSRQLESHGVRDEIMRELVRALNEVRHLQETNPLDADDFRAIPRPPAATAA